MTAYQSSCTVAVVLTIFSGLWVLQRRLVWLLGRNGPALAPALLVIVWLAFVMMGSLAGSLASMAWIGAAPLLVAAILSSLQPTIRVRHHLEWTSLDCAVFAFCSLMFLLIGGNDSLGHNAIVASYLRGNIPPTAFNDPSFPLVYHHAFDGAAAVVAAAFGLDSEAALDVVSIGCIAATLSALVPISRQLFSRPVTQQCARVLFLLGFGLPRMGVWALLTAKLSYWPTAQPYIGIIFRRPMALNYVIFAYLLAALLPRVRGSTPAPHRSSAPFNVPDCALLPAALLLPLTSEELTVYSTLVVLLLWVFRRLATRTFLAWGGIALTASYQLGGLRILRSGHPPSALPRLHLSWPPSWPDWSSPNRVMPLISTRALEMVSLELGAVFLVGIALALRSSDRRQRALAGFALLGWSVASVTTLGGWVKSDVDRFLFYGTTVGFLLGANCIEACFTLRDRWALPRWVCSAAVFGLVAFSSFTSVAQMTVWAATRKGWEDARPRDALMERVSSILGEVVGPRERILTNPLFAGPLISRGFVVYAPLSSSMIALVTPDWSRYLSSRSPLRPDWLFLHEECPLVVGQQPHLRIGSYVLVKRKVDDEAIQARDPRALDPSIPPTLEIR